MNDDDNDFNFMYSQEELEQLYKYIDDLLADEYTAKSPPALEIKCECGADKCKTTHAMYCPKYKKV